MSAKAEAYTSSLTLAISVNTIFENIMIDIRFMDYNLNSDKKIIIQNVRLLHSLHLMNSELKTN